MISISLADLSRERSWAYSKGIGRDLEPVDGVFEMYRAYVGRLVSSARKDGTLSRSNLTYG